MTLDVRTIEPGEIEAWVAAMRIAFQEGTGAEPAEVELRSRHLDLARTWAAFDGSRVVGTLRSFSTQLTLPGGSTVPAAALTHVTVLPTHRRQGILTRMLEADLAASASSGDAVGLLVAAEHPIYGRFGYGPAADAMDLEVDVRAAHLSRPTDGRVELVDRDALRAEAPAVYDTVRRGQPGAVEREGWWWDIVLGLVELPGRPVGHRFFALGRDEQGAVDGFVTYRASEQWSSGRPVATLEIDDLVGVDTPAVARLWSFCLSIDWVAHLRARERSTHDLLLLLLTDARVVVQQGRTDYLWARLLDPVRALAERRYLADGELVVDVDDPLGHASGRFLLEAGPDGSACARTGRPPDLTIDVGLLSSVYLGGYELAWHAQVGGLVEHRRGAVARADAMFRSPVAPWCATSF